MKELSIEQKAEAYDEALKKLRTMRDAWNNLETDYSPKDVVHDIDYYFPELAESKDEQMRKKCIELIKELKTFCMRDGQEECIAWLEKKGESFTKKDVDDAYLKGVCDAKRELERQGEQKPVPAWMPTFLDELRSKKNYFDWDEHKDIEGKILAIIRWMNPNYFNGKEGEQKPAEVEPRFKAGDIIKPKDRGHEPWQIMQVDILDKKYRFKDGYVIPFSQEDNYEFVEQKSAEWSEESIATISRAISIVKWAAYSDHSHPILNDEGATELVERLKSIKERVQPQQQWSEEDKDALKVVTDVFGQYGVHLLNYPTFVHWLKTLPERISLNPTWKPSEEQIGALLYIFRHYAPPATDKLAWDALQTLELMLAQLKKLREE